MKYTIEKIKAMIAEHSAGRKALENEIADLLKQEAELAAQAEAAADSGNVDDYMDLSAKKNRATATIFVKRKQMDKIPGNALPEDVARDAWADYVTDYNTDLKKKLAAYAAAKKKLCELYSDLIDTQDGALSFRELLAANSGKTAAAFAMEYIPVRKGLETKGLIKKGGINTMDPDAVFFLSAYEIENNRSIIVLSSSGYYDPEQHRVNNVVLAHKPSSAHQTNPLE